MDTSRMINRQMLLICFLLVVFTSFAYWQVTKADFIMFDDPSYVTENPHVQKGLTPAEIVWAFTSTHSNNWHPLTYISHMIDVQLFGLNPGRHHLVNLLFHIVNSLLVFIVFRKMTGVLWPNALIAAFFALHPLHVESVAWIAERKDVLSTFFFLLTLWAYIYYVKKPDIKRYIAVLFFFIVGIMSKPMIVILPFVLLLLDFWPFGRLQEAQKVNLVSSKNDLRNLNNKQKTKQQAISDSDKNIKQTVINFHWPAIFPLIREKIPFFAIAVISGIITVYAQQGVIKPIEQYSLPTRIANTFVSYTSYIKSMLWPDSLAIFYPYGGDLSTGNVVISIVLFILISAAVILLRRPYLITGWLWYLGTLIPVIGLVQVGLQARADRYTYIPLIGIFIMITYGFAELVRLWPQLKKILALIAGCIVVVLTILTVSQVSTWQNSGTLYQHATEVTANNYWAHYNLGLYLAKQNNDEKALYHFSESLRIKPRQDEAILSIGSIMARKGDKENAIACFKDAIRINPNSSTAYNNWSLLLSKTGEHEKAIPLLEKSLQINEKDSATHYLLGISLANIGQSDKAVLHLSEALRLAPQQPVVHNALGIILLNRGKIDEAIEHFRQALLIAPAYPEARKNIRIALELRKNNSGQ
ncbi:MAG: tetratricopeptide repeat protein [Smithellaceae bacterium]